MNYYLQQPYILYYNPYYQLQYPQQPQGYKHKNNSSSLFDTTIYSSLFDTSGSSSLFRSSNPFSSSSLFQ